jgi:hypothetical protein
MNNTTTKKQYSGVKSPVADKTNAPRSASAPNHGPVYEGQIDAPDEKFARPLNAVTAAITGIGGLHNDIGEMSGFITDGYTDKQGTPYGEAAKFNYLPPGMDISNQLNAEINEMPLRKLVAESYPGDGWMPSPRDLKE